MSFYIAEECIPVSIYDERATVVYNGSKINLSYEMEPPHGDFIYSAILPIIDKHLPCWIYGRNLMFVDAHYLFADGVVYNTYNPVTSFIFNIHTGQYVNLNAWYNNRHVEKSSIELINSFDNRRIVIDNPQQLNWSFM